MSRLTDLKSRWTGPKGVFGVCPPILNPEQEFPMPSSPARAIAIDDDVNIDNDVNVDNDVAAADANTSVCDNKKVV